MHRVMLYISERGAVVFRNNSGFGFIGKVVQQDRISGKVVLKDARPVRFGVGPNGKGGSDLIGWTSVPITPEMVGKNIAVFTAIETKSEKGKAREEQAKFIAAVRSAGGIAVIAKTVDEVEAAFSAHMK